MSQGYYVIRADLDHHPDCIDAEHGVYVDKTESNYTTLRNAKRYPTRAAAQAAMTERWEVVEAILPKRAR
jgi:hypothetical protein